ncbi:uncharacterized protein LOC128729211 [Anopheles nili]|uniref:uncharacterized protein LOC128729211 n=1 Tax=Anopheles nili TaxID=185578 RepID=UPI00237BEA83|nr:uncharacterized protein LOC128729211 [Anopheles nili]
MFKTIQLHNTNISPTGGEYIRPSTPRQYSAIKRPEFQRLLRLLTIYPPTVQCKFHRIPFALSPPMLRKRHTVLIRYIKANGYYPLEQSKAMQIGLDKQETKPLEETGGSSTKRNRWDSSDSELEPAVNQKKPRRKAIIISDEDEP